MFFEKLGYSPSLCRLSFSKKVFNKKSTIIKITTKKVNIKSVKMNNLAFPPKFMKKHLESDGLLPHLNLYLNHKKFLEFQFDL